MAPNGYEEVVESFGAHEDDLLLRPSFVGVVRIALIFLEKRTYRRRSMDYCLHLQEQDVAGGDGVKVFTHSEGEAYYSLALDRLQASDRQAKCRSHGIDDTALRGSRSEMGAKSLGKLKPLATD
jgi:hypothetical protein